MKKLFLIAILGLSFMVYSCKEVNEETTEEVTEEVILEEVDTLVIEEPVDPTTEVEVAQ
jgi:hypothetical protein